MQLHESQNAKQVRSMKIRITNKYRSPGTDTSLNLFKHSVLSKKKKKEVKGANLHCISSVVMCIPVAMILRSCASLMKAIEIRYDMQ